MISFGALMGEEENEELVPDKSPPVHIGAFL